MAARRKPRAGTACQTAEHKLLAILQTDHIWKCGKQSSECSGAGRATRLKTQATCCRAEAGLKHHLALIVVPILPVSVNTSMFMSPKAVNVMSTALEAISHFQLFVITGDCWPPVIAAIVLGICYWCA